MTFSEKLQLLRKQNNLSQEQLALKLGVSRQAISKWENDNTLPDINNIIKIAQLFNVSYDYLLNDYETDTKKENIRSKKGLLFYAALVIGIGTLGLLITWIIEPTIEFAFHYRLQSIFILFLFAGFCMAIIHIIIESQKKHK